MQAEQTVRVAVFGRTDLPAARPLLAWLDQAPQLAWQHESFPPPADWNWDLAGAWPDLIVLIESQPGDFGHHCVERLLQQLPLARILCCQHDWCASEGRTVGAWPEAIRIPLRAAISRLQLELEAVRGQRAPLPLTAAREEIFEYHFGQRVHSDQQSEPEASSPLRARVEILSHDPAWKSTLEEYFAASESDATEPLVQIVDLDPWSDSQLTQLEQPTTAARLGISYWCPQAENLIDRRLLSDVLSKNSPLWYVRQVVSQLAASEAAHGY